MRLRNTNPLGRVDLPIIGREGDELGEGLACLEPGEEFDVDDEIGAALLQQVGNFEPVDGPALVAAAVMLARTPEPEQPTVDEIVEPLAVPADDEVTE